MMALSLGAICANVWEQVLREEPAGWFHWWVPELGMTYREWLMRPKRNAFGEVIPQIAIVRKNLRRLGRAPRAPRLPQ